MGRIRDLVYGSESGGAWALRAAVPTPPAPAPVPAPRAETSDPPGEPLSLEDAIAAAIGRRVAEFTLADALEMPAVIRAVQLICSLIAEFQPIAYRDGTPVPEQPRLLTQPAPFGTRYQFLYQTIYSQLAMAGSAGTGGDAYWLVVDRDELDLPRSAIVLDPGEVRIEWDDRRFLPVYTWREQRVGSRSSDVPARDFLHLTIGRPPGALHGRSPLIAGLGALAVVDAAERYALGFFETSGIPSVVIKAAGKGSPAEAAKLKAQWMAAHAGPEATPAVMFEGNTGKLELEYPSVDAEKAQLQQARDRGTTIVAILLGIPAPLLHVMTSGATITYTNAGGALDEFVRATAQPVYLTPLEEYLSTLVPRTQTVRFGTNELYRIDLAGRLNAYAVGIASGVLSAPEARMFEGWPATSPIESVPAYAATPALPALPTSEVPIRV